MAPSSQNDISVGEKEPILDYVKKTNEWVLNKAGAVRELLNSIKSRKLAWSHNEETIR